jgi:hypothetical protein
MEMSRWFAYSCVLVASLVGCGASLSTVKQYEAQRNLDGLVGLIHNDDDAVRREAEMALRRMGDQAVDALVRGLQSEDRHHRFFVAWVLGSIGEKRAVPALIAALARETDGDARVAIAEALERTGDIGALVPLGMVKNVMVANEADSLMAAELCRRSERCAKEGECGFHPDSAYKFKELVPAAVACLKGQKCDESKTELCEARSDAYCRASVACAQEQRCYVSGSHCVKERGL